MDLASLRYIFRLRLNDIKMNILTVYVLKLFILHCIQMLYKIYRSYIWGSHYIKYQQNIVNWVQSNLHYSIRSVVIPVTIGNIH